MVNIRIIQRALRVTLIAAFAVVSACGTNSAGASDGTADGGAPTSVVTQTPSSTTTSPPSTTTVEVSPNGVAGENNIADNFNASALLTPTVEAVPQMGDPVGAFRFTCLAGQLSRDDPIVYPGQPGRSHLHQFFGNMLTNSSSNYQSLRTGGGSTCTRNANSTDPTPQRSAYWMPAMLDGVGNAVKPDYMQTYYKQLPNGNPECQGAPDATHIGYCIPMPNGLRFIQGYNMDTGRGGPTDANSGDYWAMGFDCVTTDGEGTSYTGFKRSMAEILATGRCPVGAWLRVAVSFPDCWDGRNLDSADHRSHMAYASGALIDNFKRACPATHPYNIPEIALQAFFRVDANFIDGKWSLASDAMAPAGAPAGSTLHADYWEAWSPTVKNMWQTGCIDRHLSCNVGELGNGQTLPGMSQVGPYPNHVLVPLSSIR